MTFLFYKNPTSNLTVYGLHWFYAKKNQFEDFTPPTGSKGLQFSEWNLDFNQSLSLSEVSLNLMKSYYLGQIFRWSMYNANYFFDPINGYCKCDYLHNKVNKDSYHYINQLNS